MKAYEFEVDNKRNKQREELFILTIVERVLAGFLSSISFIDQAQFCDLLAKRMKDKKVVQPLHIQIMGRVKRNLIKNQSPIQEQKVNYEIRTVASSSIDMRKNYIHTFSNRNQNNKEQQTTDIDYQLFGMQGTNRSKNIKLDKTYNSAIVKVQSNKSQQQNDSTVRYINPFQLNSPNSTQVENNQRDFTLQKQNTISETNFTSKIEKPTINIVSQDGEIEQQEFINQNKNNNTHQPKRIDTQNNEYQSNKNQPYIHTTNQTNNSRVELIESNRKIEQQQVQKTNSRKQSYNLPMGSDSSKMDLKERLLKYYSNDEDEDEFSGQRKQMTQSDRLKQITYGTHTELPEQEKQINQQIIQSAKQLDSKQEIKLPRSNKSNQSVKFQSTQKLSQNIEQQFNQQSTQQNQEQNYQDNLNLLHQQYTPKKSIEETNQNGNFLSPPQSSRTLKSAKSTKTKFKTQISNEQKKIDIQQSDNSNSKDESQLSLLDQSLHKEEKQYSHTLRPATTHVEFHKQEDIPSFQTHDNIDQIKKQGQSLLQQQTSITSIMHDEEHFQNQGQQINIQVNQCDPPPTNNAIIEEQSLENSPVCRMANQQQPSSTSFSQLKLEETKNSSAYKFEDQRQGSVSYTYKQQLSPTNHQIPTSNFIQSQNNISIQQSQQKMLIPINNTQSSNKNNRSTNKSRSQIKDTQLFQMQQQQRSEDSLPESKLTIESSQGDKSNRSKVIQKAKQLKLPAAAVALNFARRKSSNQISPVDPKKLEQQEKEKQKQIEYQKQLEKMKYERELMEQFKIPDNMPLNQKRAIIEQLINQLESTADQDVKYQIMLYKQRQEQIQNQTKLELQYNKNVSTCYDELFHLTEGKLKLLGKDADSSKVQFLKFEDQVQTHFPGQSKAFSQELNSPIKKNLRFLSKLDPVEIENQMNRIKEFKQESEMLKFFQSFNSQYDKEIYQCDLDLPTEKDYYHSVDFQKGLLPKMPCRRRKLKKKSTKMIVSTFKIDPKKIEKVIEQSEKIKQVGQFLL